MDCNDEVIESFSIPGSRLSDLKECFVQLIRKRIEEIKGSGRINEPMPGYAQDLVDSLRTKNLLGS